MAGARAPQRSRSVLYGTIVVAAVVLIAAGIVASRWTSRARQAGRDLLGVFPWVALAGMAGLLLDHRDGPRRLVHLVIYVCLVVAAIRLARVVAAINRSESIDDVEPDR